MKIKCPQCCEITELEHVDLGSVAECACGKIFEINSDTIIEEYTEVDNKLPLFVDKYPVKAMLGFGGMGKVYLGVHPELNIPIAIKALRMEYMTDRASCDRFIQSAKICAKMNHPNIVRIYDCGYYEDNVFLVMEYISGGSAQILLEQEGKLKPDHAALIMLEVCSGLMEAEKFGIVHRDIKPDNIMFDQEGNVKILDLGLSKISGDSRLNKKTITASLTSLGTPQYMAPEQALDATNCDSRADIYSIGITLYQFCTGKLPFDSKDTSELRRMHAQDLPVPPSNLEPDLSREMEYIILKCIEKKREARYANITELALDLEAFLKNRILPSTMNQSMNSLSVFAKKEDSFRTKTGVSVTTVVVLFSIILLALILTGILYLYSMPSSEEESKDNVKTMLSTEQVLSRLQNQSDVLTAVSNYKDAAKLYLSYTGDRAKETAIYRTSVGEGLRLSAVHYKKLMDRELTGLMLQGKFKSALQYYETHNGPALYPEYADILRGLADMETTYKQGIHSGNIQQLQEQNAEVKSILICSILFRENRNKRTIAAQTLSKLPVFGSAFAQMPELAVELVSEVPDKDSVRSR